MKNIGPSTGIRTTNLPCVFFNSLASNFFIGQIKALDN